RPAFLLLFLMYSIESPWIWRRRWFHLLGSRFLQSPCWEGRPLERFETGWQHFQQTAFPRISSLGTHGLLSQVFPVCISLRNHTPEVRFLLKRLARKPYPYNPHMKATP